MKISIVCLLGCMCLSVFSQQVTISGGVVDAFTQRPLDKTNIYIGHKAGSSSDSDGFYQYRVAAGEPVVLTYSYAGYESVHLSFVPMGDTLINVALQPKVYDMNTFIVTGVHRERLLKDSPTPIQVVSHQEIEATGYDEVTDVLSHSIPGLSLKNDNMGTAITIDGLSSKYVLILIDGKRMAGETDGNIDFSRLNTLNIERIEIIKGSGSLLYGSNAISGVVNIITKSADEDGVEASVNSRYASFNTYNVGTVVNLKKGIWKATTDAQYKHTDGYYKAPFISQKAYNDLNLNQKISCDMNDRLTIMGDVGYYHHERFDDDAPKHPIYSDVRESLSLNYKMDDTQYLKMEHAADRYTTMQKVNFSGNEVKDYQNTLMTNRVVYINEIGHHALQVGAELLNDRLYAVNVKDSTQQQMSTSLFASDEYAFDEQLSLVASSRYVYSNTFSSAFVPGLSLMYKLDRVNLRTSYAMGYRSPTLKELYMDFDHLGWFTMIGNPDLKPETSHYTTVSAEYYNAKFMASVAVYHNLVNDKILETSPYDSDLVTYYNVDKVRIWGSNIRLKATFLRLIKLTAGLSLQDPINVTTGIQLESTYKVSGNMRLDFTHPLGQGDIGCCMMGSAFSSTTLWDMDDDGEVIYADCSPYQMYDATLYYHHDSGLSFTGAVNNVFDYTDYDNKSTYSPGRSFSLSLTYHFNANN